MTFGESSEFATLEGMRSESFASKGGLRQKILAFVGALVLLSLLGSTLSLYRITEVSRSLDAINRVSVPLGRVVAQLQADGEVFRRELERRMSSRHWSDPHWRPKPIPRWIEDLMSTEIGRVEELTSRDLPWSSPDSRARWREWAAGLREGFAQIRAEAAKLNQALEREDLEQAASVYPAWEGRLADWMRQLQWGASEYERSLRRTFAQAEEQVSHLRTGLEIILAVVVSLSLLLLWLGERALRPLGELTRLAREITRRGLRREDKAVLPEASRFRDDEVGQLSSEFHRMATALLEREKALETEKSRVEEQYRLLREMGRLNEDILRSIDSVLIVSDPGGSISQCNPVAVRWLGAATVSEVIGTALGSWQRLRALDAPGSCAIEPGGPRAIEPRLIDGRVYGGNWLPLIGGASGGGILVLDDLTEEKELAERLRRAEHLAAVGRMSAQVAHEVRNPLHSIGLEAEMASDLAARSGSPELRQSLQSILAGVDRLEKITENYLRLSRLSSGERSDFDLGEALESVLATYASACEAEGVSVDWSREGGASPRIWGDRDLLEQALGNLFRNALQALGESRDKRVTWRLGTAESGRVWIRIEDSGPGIAPEIREKLFTPFVTTRAQGTGLGLSFVKKVLDDHGGEIDCVPSKGSRGAAFEIRLPPAEPLRAHRAPDAAAERSV